VGYLKRNPYLKNLQLKNTKDNMKILKGAREKHNVKERTIGLTADLSTTVSIKLWDTLANVPRNTRCQPGTKTQ